MPCEDAAAAQAQAQDTAGACAAATAGDRIMLCQEFMPKGDLWRALAQDRTGQLGWYNRWDLQPWLSMQLTASKQGRP